MKPHITLQRTYGTLSRPAKAGKFYKDGLIHPPCNMFDTYCVSGVGGTTVNLMSQVPAPAPMVTRTWVATRIIVWDFTTPRAPPQRSRRMNA